MISAAHDLRVPYLFSCLIPPRRLRRPLYNRRKWRNCIILDLCCAALPLVDSLASILLGQMPVDSKGWFPCSLVSYERRMDVLTSSNQIFFRIDTDCTPSNQYAISQAMPAGTNWSILKVNASLRESSWLLIDLTECFLDKYILVTDVYSKMGQNPEC